MDNGMAERRAYESEIATTRLGDSYGSASKQRLKALRQSAVSGTAVRGATRGNAKSAENTTGPALLFWLARNRTEAQQVRNRARAFGARSFAHRTDKQDKP